MRFPKLAILLIVVCIVVSVTALFVYRGYHKPDMQKNDANSNGANSMVSRLDRTITRLDKLKDFDAAVSECKKAIDENKNNPFAVARLYLYLGTIHFDQGISKDFDQKRFQVNEKRLEDAKAAYLSSIEISQNRNEPAFKICAGFAKESLARCNIHLGRLDEALQILEALIWEYPDESDVRQFTGGQIETLHIGRNALGVLGNLAVGKLAGYIPPMEQIIPTLKDIAARHPNDSVKAGALYYIAEHYQKSADTSAAIATYKKLIALYPNETLASKARKQIEIVEKREAEKERKLRIQKQMDEEN